MTVEWKNGDECVWVNGEATLMIDGDTPEEARQAALILDNHSQLTEENAKLRDALQWTHKKLIEEGKRYGASTKRAEISKLLNQLKDQNNDK